MVNQLSPYFGPKGFLKLLITLCFIGISIGFVVFFDYAHPLILLAMVVWSAAAILALQTLRRYRHIEAMSGQHSSRRIKQAENFAIISMVLFLAGLAMVGVLYKDILASFMTQLTPIPTGQP